MGKVWNKVPCILPCCADVCRGWRPDLTATPIRQCQQHDMLRRHLSGRVTPGNAGGRCRVPICHQPGCTGVDERVEEFPCLNLRTERVSRGVCDRLTSSEGRRPVLTLPRSKSHWDCRRRRGPYNDQVNLDLVGKQGSVVVQKKGKHRGRLQASLLKR